MAESPVFLVFKDYNLTSSFSCVGTWVRNIGIKESVCDTKHAKSVGIDSARLIASIPMTLGFPTGASEEQIYKDKNGIEKKRKVQYKVIDPAVMIIKQYKVKKVDDKKPAAKPKKTTKTSRSKDKPKTPPEVFTDENGKQWIRDEKVPSVIHKANNDFRYLFSFILVYGFIQDGNNGVLRKLIERIAGDMDIDLIVIFDKEDATEGLEQVVNLIKTDNQKILQDTKVLFSMLKYDRANNTLEKLSIKYISFFYQIARRLAQGRLYSEKAPHYSIENFFTILKILANEKDEQLEVNQVFADFKIFYKNYVEPSKPKKQTKVSTTGNVTNEHVVDNVVVDDAGDKELHFDEGSGDEASEDNINNTDE